jgi:SNF2 family DNA or RNA helicase
MPVLNLDEAPQQDDVAYVDADLNEKGDRIVVKFKYDFNDVKRIKAIPGARFTDHTQPGGPFWRVPRDVTSARMLREQFEDRLRCSERMLAWGRLAVAKADKLVTLAAADDAELEFVSKAYGKTKIPMKDGTEVKGLHNWLRPYQRAGAAFMAEADCINADQPGTGKTAQTIAAILERDKGEGSHLIVAPKTSLNVVWEAEIDLLAPDMPVITMSGDDSKEVRAECLALAKEFHEDGTPFFLVLNPAFVRFEKDKDAPKVAVRGKLEFQTKPVYPELFEFEWSTIVFDEYHKMGLSNNKTMMFEAANKLKGQHKMLLSGTPMGGKPIKLWGALHFLEPERFTSKWRWIDEWLVTDDNGFGKVVQGVQPGKEDKFWEHLRPYMVRRTKAEVLPQLPPKQRIDRWVEMTPKQKKQYDTFAANAELKIEEENLSATGILAEYMRLKQFACAHQKVKHMGNGDIKVMPTFESGHLPYILEILEERGIAKRQKNKAGEWVYGEDDGAEGDEQVIIFSQFSTMVDMIEDYLNNECGIETVKITGKVSQARRTEIAKAFQEEGGPRVMVVTTTAGGVALTLDRASTVIFTDETWDPDDQEQAEDRAHRASRLHQVTCYYLRSKNTIQEYIANLVEGKAITNREILDLRRMGLRAV